MGEEKASAYIIIGVILIFILFIAGFLIISTLNLRKIKANDETGNNTQEQEVNENCKSDEECEDGNKCTLESCVGGVCISTEVKLCYNNDGCCPVGCNSGNDNDCLRIPQS
jgi:hypothetical protein